MSVFGIKLSILIFVGILLFTLIHIYLPINQVNSFFDNFNKLALGVSALIASIAGSSYFLEEFNRRRKIAEYLRQYPHNNYGKDWYIYESLKSPGAYYVYDTRKNLKHHILNMKTVYDLGWHIYLPSSKKISDSKFISALVGERIRTRGEAGE